MSNPMANEAQRLICSENDGEYSFNQSSKNNFFKHLSKKLTNKFDKSLSLKPTMNHIEKSIEAKVEKFKLKAVEKYNSKKRGLKKYIIGKVLESFGEKDDPEINKRKAEENNHPNPFSKIEQQRKGPDTEFICQFCNDRIVSIHYEEHTANCIYREENNITRCGDCGEYCKLTEVQKHYKDCVGNVENTNIQCEQCNKMIALKSYSCHLELCSKQYQNVGSDIHDKHSQVRSQQLPECAICLLEIKNDGSSLFLECAHQYHSECINDWAKKQKTCPMCMFEFSQ